MGNFRAKVTMSPGTVQANKYTIVYGSPTWVHCILIERLKLNKIGVNTTFKTKRRSFKPH